MPNVSRAGAFTRFLVVAGALFIAIGIAASPRNQHRESSYHQPAPESSITPPSQAAKPTIEVSQAKATTASPAKKAGLSQALFVQGLNQLAQEYSDALNDPQRSVVRKKRADWLRDKTRETQAFENWTGVLRNLGTDNKGDITTLSISIDKRLTVRIVDPIRYGSRLFSVLLSASSGDQVIISGVFLSSPDRDTLRELSMTESGMMRHSEFAVQITDVRIAKKAFQ